MASRIEGRDGCRIRAAAGIPRALASLVRAPFVLRKGRVPSGGGPPRGPLLKEGEASILVLVDTRPVSWYGVGRAMLMRAFS